MLRELRVLLPAEDVLYLADQANVPYGTHSLDEVRGYARGAVRYFLERGAKLVVMACNTASAAALHEMRLEFPALPFVGMEPAVKPAAEGSRTRKVAVIATQATFQGRLFSSVVERFAEGVEVFRQPCPGLVECVEAGVLDGPDLELLLRGWLDPLKAMGIDRLVLGCTHYPLVRKSIEAVLGPSVTVIDPSAAIARQVRRVLDKAGILAADGGSGRVECLTSGSDLERYSRQIALFLGESPRPQALRWLDGRLSSAEIHAKD